MSEATLSLQSADFKALSSKTRVGVLKALQSRPHTVSELSSRLDLSAPTLKEHVEVLISAGLV